MEWNGIEWNGIEWNLLICKYKNIFIKPGIKPRHKTRYKASKCEL